MGGANCMMTVTRIPSGLDTPKREPSVSFITCYQYLAPKKATLEDFLCLGGGTSLPQRMLSSTLPWLAKLPTRFGSPARRESSGDEGDRRSAWPECGK